MKINLTVEDRPDGYLMVTSVDVPGLLLLSRDVEAVFADIPNGLRLLLKNNSDIDWPQGVSDD